VTRLGLSAQSHGKCIQECGEGKLGTLRLFDNRPSAPLADNTLPVGTYSILSPFQPLHCFLFSEIFDLWDHCEILVNDRIYLTRTKNRLSPILDHHPSNHTQSTIHRYVRHETNIFFFFRSVDRRTHKSPTWVKESHVD